MGLNTLFKGRKVKTDLGHGKSITRKIASIKENQHKYSDGQVLFKNYSVHFTTGEMEIFNSLEDINFVKPFITI